MVIVVAAGEDETVSDLLAEAGEIVFRLGTVVAAKDGAPPVIYSGHLDLGG
jgi:hypothetical protein